MTETPLRILTLSRVIYHAVSPAPKHEVLAA